MIQVPFESLKRAAKERKTLVDRTLSELSGLSDLKENAEITKEHAIQHLDNIVERLSSLKRKARFFERNCSKFCFSLMKSPFWSKRALKGHRHD